MPTAGYSVAHDSLYFRDPYEPHPERWLHADHPLHDGWFRDDMEEAWNTCSQVPRVCIAVSLAYSEMRIALSEMIWHYDWEPKSQGID